MRGGVRMKFNVKKVEAVATTVNSCDISSSPWKECKKQCL